MMYLTKTQLLKAFKNGQLDEVAKQLRRYGKIVHDTSYEIESGHYKGSHRDLNINHHGFTWDLNLHNGEVKYVEYQTVIFD